MNSGPNPLTGCILNPVTGLGVVAQAGAGHGLNLRQPASGFTRGAFIGLAPLLVDRLDRAANIAARRTIDDSQIPVQAFPNSAAVLKIARRLGSRRKRCHHSQNGQQNKFPNRRARHDHHYKPNIRVIGELLVKLTVDPYPRLLFVLNVEPIDPA